MKFTLKEEFFTACCRVFFLGKRVVGQKRSMAAAGGNCLGNTSNRRIKYTGINSTLDKSALSMICHDLSLTALIQQ